MPSRLVSAANAGPRSEWAGSLSWAQYPALVGASSPIPAQGGEATVDVVDELGVEDGAGAEGAPALVEVSGRAVPAGRRRTQAPTRAPTTATAAKARFTAAPGR